MWCFAALALLCTFLGCNYSRNSASHCLCCYRRLLHVAFTHRIRATTHPSPSDLKPVTKDTFKFQDLPSHRYISLTLSPLCFPSPLQKYPISKAGARFRGAIGSIDSFDCLFDWIAVADAAKSALTPALVCGGCRWLPSSCCPHHRPQGTPPFTLDHLAALGLSGFCWTNPKGATLKLVAETKQVDASVGSEWRKNCLWVFWFLTMF